MLQFYFLSVILNLLAGLILIYGTNFLTSSQNSALNEKSDDFSGMADDENSTSSDAESMDMESDDSDVATSFASENKIIDDYSFRLVIGILSVMVSLFKILSPIQNDVKVVGDLLPVISGFASGFVLVYEFFSTKSVVNFKLPEPIETAIKEGRKYIGVFCVLIAVVHFICPRVLFL